MRDHAKATEVASSVRSTTVRTFVPPGHSVDLADDQAARSDKLRAAGEHSGNVPAYAHIAVHQQCRAPSTFGGQGLVDSATQRQPAACHAQPHRYRRHVDTQCRAP